MSTPQSGLFAGQNYSFKPRFGDGSTPESRGTNPEELLVSAHAGCFSMALSLVLGQVGFVADSINTRAEVTMEPGMGPGPTVTGVTLVLTAKVPGIDAAQIQQIAEAAKAGCVISRALAVPVSLQATLER